ncbi:MAG TPA: hypothetical protein VF823_09035, partial [Anaerolineales bacterium]
MKKLLISLVLLLIIAAAPLASLTNVLAADNDGSAGYSAASSDANSTATPSTASPNSTSVSSSFPQDVNPLTGQPVKDQALLALPPALVSVSNFPVTA